VGTGVVPVAAADSGGGSGAAVGAIAGVAVIGGIAAAVVITRQRRAAARALAAAPAQAAAGAYVVDGGGSNPMHGVLQSAPSFRDPNAAASARFLPTDAPPAAGSGGDAGGPLPPGWTECFSKSRQLVRRARAWRRRRRTPPPPHAAWRAHMPARPTRPARE